jgi:hypothetical protein
MPSEEGERPGWAYYGAIALFVGILGFAVLGLVRSSSLVGSPAGSASREPSPTKAPPNGVLSAGPVPTVRIPPPTASVATPPPSRTYIHPPPESEAVYSDRAAEPRR